MWSFAPHDLSMILALVDEAPSTVTAQGASSVTPGIADWCICHMRFPSGIAGPVTSSWLPPFKAQRLAVIGEHGMLVFAASLSAWHQMLALSPPPPHTSVPLPFPHPPPTPHP